MTSHSGHSLAEVLAVAKIHPFYDASVQYPPDADTLKAARDQAGQQTDVADLTTQPLLLKPTLYTAIKRLINDTSPQNTFRRSIYTSTTGGGTGAQPLFFATDVHENRKQRADFGRFLRAMGLVKETDWVVSVHTSGELYRSLDLTLELLENAGASVLGAGNHLPPAEVMRLASVYHANVLSGDSSQMLQLAHYISTMTPQARAAIKIDKIVYTSETLTAAQRKHIIGVLGPIEICSILGSAEAGPYAVSCPHLVETDAAGVNQDFVFDTRLMLIEILPFEATNGDAKAQTIMSVPQGEQGVVAQTSLSRLRNPIVRYITGDVGSLHDLPEHAKASVSEAHLPYLRILRLRGRDSRFSFEWDGEYIEFHGLTALFNTAKYGVLQWQAILDKSESSSESVVEIRVLCEERDPGHEANQALERVVRKFFHVYERNAGRFSMVFVNELDGFVRSSTGRKVIKFVDRFT